MEKVVWSLRGGGLVLVLLPLFVCFKPTVSVSDTLNTSLSFGKRCVNPEECCEYPMFSTRFNECCDKKSCFPKSCPTPIPGNIIIRKDCDNAWSCCRFWHYREVFNQCCIEHGCCPLCEQVSRGCCYNGMMVEWGSMLEEFPELCMKLVCAARVSPTSHFLTAVVLPVKFQDHLCSKDPWCDDCLEYSCVDDTGLLQVEGSKWSPDECHECLCSNGKVTCLTRPIICPNPPHNNCVKIPGPCCPTWNCTTGCVDENGEDHDLGTSWYSHPCIYHTCTVEGIMTRITDCFLGDPIHPSCVKFTPVGECCPKWNCSGCVDHEGAYHAVGRQWVGEDPCIIFVCTEGGIKMRRVYCEDPSPPRPGCQSYIPEGDCCPQWNCSECVDQIGTRHPLHHVWKTDPCTTNLCTRNGIQTTREPCDLGYSPHPSCEKVTPPGKCCPEWKCRGCFDQGGRFHPLGHEWSAGDPCLVFVCTVDGIILKYVRCEDTKPPHVGCSEYTPAGKCCPQWNCSDCVDNTGTRHPLYDLWKSDPCTTHFCTKNGIQTTREQCDLGPPPHPSCYKITPPGECCQEWKCRGCFDADGNYHELGHEWDTGDPCLVFFCEKDGITLKRVYCDSTSPPRSGCSEYIPEGECCPKWNCSGCVDHTGSYRPLYAVWKTDPCTTHLCMETGIQTTHEECDLGPAPHPSCLRISPPGECCPEWKCSGCLDAHGNYHERGEKWSTIDPCLMLMCTKEGIKAQTIQCEVTRPPPGCPEYTPKGECCPKWNCSVCVDHTGKQHPLYEVWKTDPCTTHVCLQDGIKTSRENCNLGSAPHPSCREIVPLGECCPEWNCRGCIDLEGNYHELGQEWSTEDPCLVFICARDGISARQIHCEETRPPHIGCQEYTQKGECCPKWNCSGCVDHTGIYHPLYDVWKTDPCTTHLCMKKGIETTREDCDLGPAPHSSCVKDIPTGECCTEWKCRGCLDTFGTLRKIGETWSTVDPCLMFHCTTGGITTERIHCDDTSPPHIGCLEYKPKGECCPKWNCSGCIDHTGIYHPLYDVWKTDSCTTHLCTKNGIQTTREDCDLGPAPHPSCVKVTLPGECCPDWNCRGCLDQFGTLHEIGEDWITVDPCLVFHCTTGGITTERIRCDDTIPPHIGCREYTPKGECCPKWNCSGCVDYTGTYHPLYDVWKTDPCTTHLCTENGIETTKEKCDLGPAPHHSCVKVTPPGECCPEWECRGCLDPFGTLHEIGETWSTVDPCLLFHCTTGGITTERIRCDDTIPPHIGCLEYTPKGECCPKWNCSGCVDHTSTYHPLYDVWKNDPCTTHLCTKNGIETTREKCDLGPAPHHSCVKVTPPGECCPEWECRGCLDQFGTLHEIGETWSTVDPCLLFHCTTGGITTERIHCEDSSPPHIGCLKYTPKGECCPQWNCSGCVDRYGTYHTLYDVWKTDPCTTHLCTKNGIQTTREDCDMGPAPHPSCVKITLPGECCPDWNCRGCLDQLGTLHEIGEAWDSVDPCLVFHCTTGGITTERIRCNDTIPPHIGCREYTPKGECCPKWNCSGCVDYTGTYHPLYDVWKTDPCTTHLCTKNGIETTREKCDLGPAPHPSCAKVSPPGECCPEWKCRGCLDQFGTLHEIGEAWNTVDPCLVFHCTTGGITTERIHCDDSSPPHIGCKEYTPKNECCPKWNCSGCVDHTGTYHPLYDVWKTDPCTTHLCTRNGIQTTREPCDLGSIPHPSCEKFTLPGECCPEWKCRGCFDPSDKFHEMGEEWSTGDSCTVFICTTGGIETKRIICEPTKPLHAGCQKYTPEGECCPKWNCSGCVDRKGTYHPLYDVWKTDPCTTHICTRNGIQTTREPCDLGPAPHPSCENVSLPGECCSEWKCRGCFDRSGKFHELGEEWSTGNPCTKFICTRGGIKTKLMVCEPTKPPHAGCQNYTPEGECCPKWNCSGCVDHTGTYHPLYEVWKTDPCTTKLCTKNGIQTTKENCNLGPAPHPSCVKYIPFGKCCPKWNCTGCFDADGTFYPLHKVWKSDPCTTQVCTKAGIKTTKENCTLGPARHASCVKYIHPGNCCPEWNCTGCYDKRGQHHELYSKWKTSTCIAHECTPEGIITTMVKCIEKPHPNCEEVPPPPGMCCPDWNCGQDCRLVRCAGPPRDDCLGTRPPLACCNIWNCSNACYDEFGTLHSLGHVWKTDPCTTLTCTTSGIVVSVEQCGIPPPQPHPDCVKYTPAGECCYQWNCSGCVDYNGTYHPLHHTWRTDPCTTHTCMASGITTAKTLCHFNPAPNVNCVNFTAPGECCPKWECRGCVDEDGDYGEGDRWQSLRDPCLQCTCKEGTVMCTAMACAPPPPWPCFPPRLPGHCCPNYCEQPELLGCVDNGVQHKEGERWTDPQDPCRHCNCSQGVVRCRIEVCGRPPVYPCIPYKLPGQCCPSSCEPDSTTKSSVLSGCEDEDGIKRELGDKWKSRQDKCIEYQCRRLGFIFSHNVCY